MPLPDNGDVSDEDSADKETITPSVNNLSGKQLVGHATATIRTGIIRTNLGDDETVDIQNNSDTSSNNASTRVE